MVITNKWHKNVKEQCDKDDEDEVQEITAARVAMKKEKACVWNMLSNICNKIWVEKKYQGRAH